MQLGTAKVDISNDYTITTFADGTRVTADHSEQPGQHDTAQAYGFDSAMEMNQGHDLMHSLTAVWFGLPASPTLDFVAHGCVFDHWQEEEALVLAAQRYAKVEST
jgi:hypothetical protein